MLCLRLFVVAFLLLASVSKGAPATKPKLVVAVIIDQFRYDYLTRFRSDYHGGLDRMMSRGADFTNAFYTQVPTVTAVGHSIFLTGAMPSMSGIVGNAWYDRDERKIVTSVCDWDRKTVGGHQEEPGQKCTDADPASPKRLLVSTVGDELRDVTEASKVIGISIKARGAIMPSGHRANAAYWFDDVSGHFVSSTFYVQDLPAWAEAYNSRNEPASYVKRTWEGFPRWHFEASAGSSRPYEKLAASPWGNELIEHFAEQAIEGEQLGQRGVTDLLTVSFSSNDYVGHAVGPDAPEVKDMAVRTDALLGNLFHLLDEKVGLGNVLVVLSADHGVAPLPSAHEAKKMPGGYISVSVERTVSSALNKRFGQADWLIPSAGETSLYFNRKALDDAHTSDGKHIEEREIFDAAKQVILDTPELHAARVYTRDQLETGVSGDLIAQAEMNGYYGRRSGDLAVVFEPFFVPGSAGTSHFSPWAYDRHVPILFMGPGIRAGRYDSNVAPIDIAPTLATMLDVQTPSGSEGRVLTEMLVTP
ncbi:MAG TPA: alkaline phosphatase family protein [Bryobacteraceae bacterium]|jgi:predicted AlkP superfamily pyrophosphatase or phosphodiesterase|nr:alkaline phosphatase family protein [Bryobacteraceae bacterium]